MHIHVEVTQQVKQMRSYTNLRLCLPLSLQHRGSSDCVCIVLCAETTNVPHGYRRRAALQQLN